MAHLCASKVDKDHEGEEPILFFVAECSATEPEIIMSASPEIVEEPIIEIPIRPEYDIGLSEELQEYTYQLCLEYEVSYEFVLAIMYCESSFRDWIKGTAGEFSLMQIHPINVPRLRQELGIKDFMNPKQNILAGVFLISELNEIYNNNMQEVAVAYNAGITGQKTLADSGIHKTRYSIKVKRVMEMLISEGTIR